MSDSGIQIIEIKTSEPPSSIEIVGRIVGFQGNTILIYSFHSTQIYQVFYQPPICFRQGDNIKADGFRSPDGKIFLTHFQPLLTKEIPEDKQVVGFVEDVIVKGMKGKETIFLVGEYKNQVKVGSFKVHSRFFCPVVTTDKICLFGSKTSDGDIYLSRPPFVVQSNEYGAIIQTIVDGTKCNRRQAEDLYQSILNRVAEIKQKDKISKDEVLSRYIDSLASRWFDQNRDSMDEFNGMARIPKYKLQKFLPWWYRTRRLRKLYLLGLNNHEIDECLEIWCLDEICQMAYENPYKLYPISLEKCLEMMIRELREITDEGKKCAQFLRVLYQNTIKKGWTGTPLIVLGREFPDLSAYKETLIKEYQVVFDGELVYLSWNYKVETEVGKYCQKKLSLEGKKPIRLRIDYEPGDEPLSDDQKEAVVQSLTCPSEIVIINGPAGSGKTRTIREIAYNLEKNGLNYQIASFTGKAVSRDKECLKGLEAKTSPSTLHRLIHNAEIERQLLTVGKKEDSRLFVYLIIDEVSMVTTELFYQFIRRYDHNFRIILVGDSNQLPPIGFGSFFSELLKTNKVPTYTLRNNHRLENQIKQNKNQDGISINSCLILDPKMEHLKESEKEYILKSKPTQPVESKAVTESKVPVESKVSNKSDDLFSDEMFAPPDDDVFIPDGNESLTPSFQFIQAFNFLTFPGDEMSVFNFFKKQFAILKPEPEEITIITPYVAEMKLLNVYLQNFYYQNYKYPYYTDSRKINWMLNDRIMMRENNYDINQYNGEEGKVIELLEGTWGFSFKDQKENVFFPIELPDPKLEIHEGKTGKIKKAHIDEQQVDIEFNKTTVRFRVGKKLIWEFFNRLGKETQFVHIKNEKRSIRVEFKCGGQFNFNLEPSPDQDSLLDSDDQKDPGEPGLIPEKEDFKRKELTVRSLEHCYACSVHRSQGSEWNIVIFYVPKKPANKHFLNKNLIYTAITRARQALYLIGEINQVELLATQLPGFRYEKLAERI